MDSTRSPQGAPMSVPHRPIQSQLSRLAIEDSRKGELCILNQYSSPSPSCSSVLSSFSHDSFTEAGSLASTQASSPEAPPPSPLTPVHARDWTDSCYIRRGSLKRDSDGEESDNDMISKKPRLHSLPGMNDLRLPPIRFAFGANEPERLDAPRFSFPNTMAEDPITQSLNLLRNRSERLRGEPSKAPLARPAGLGQTREDATPPVEQHTVLCAPQPRYEPYYLAQYPTSPMSDAKRGRAKPSKPDQPHCNVKYRPDQRDFIRYHKTDLKKTWNDIKELYARQFPSGDLDRQVQGIQGVHYRENTHIPSLSNDHRQLNFLENGHVKPINVPCRAQKDKSKFGLLWLFPERAMNYDWLPLEERQFARDLHEARQPQKERARREAIAAATWIEKPENGMCACCFKDEGDKAFKESKEKRTRTREQHNYSPRGIQGYPYSRPFPTDDLRHMRPSRL